MNDDQLPPAPLPPPAADIPTLNAALAAAQPSWKLDGGGLRGNNVPARLPVAVPDYHLSIVSTSGGRPFPDITASTSADDPIDSGDTSVYSFKLKDATQTKQGVKTYQVLIYDGYVNGQFPSGMGGNNYYLGVADGIQIYLLITFDAVTLALTSVSIATGFSIPAATLTSTVGTLFLGIGFVTVNAKGALIPHNSISSDVNFQLIYGALNGLPALLPVATWGANWLPVPP